MAFDHSKNLDDLTAEKVMGWRKAEPGWLKPDASRCLLWEPLRDTEQAFEIVERMAARGYTFSLIRVGDQYEAEFSPYQPGCVTAPVGTSESAARAICDAALQALDYTFPEPNYN